MHFVKIIAFLLLLSSSFAEGLIRQNNRDSTLFLAENAFNWTSGKDNKTVACMGLACPKCWDKMKDIAEDKTSPSLVAFPSFSPVDEIATKILVAYILSLSAKDRENGFRDALKVFVSNPEIHLDNPAGFRESLMALDYVSEITPDIAAKASRFIQIQTETLRLLGKTSTPAMIALP